MTALIPLSYPSHLRLAVPNCRAVFPKMRIPIVSTMQSRYRRIYFHAGTKLWKTHIIIKQVTKWTTTGLNISAGQNCITSIPAYVTPNGRHGYLYGSDLVFTLPLYPSISITLCMVEGRRIRILLHGMLQQICNRIAAYQHRCA